MITGATGFVGAKCLELALADGHEVAATVRPQSPARRLAPFAGRFEQLTLELNDRLALTQALSAFRPDAIIHLAWAGVANAARFDLTQISENIDAACALVEAGAAAGCKAFIGTGSQGEYGAGSTMLEDALPSPSTLYGAAKVSTLYLTRQLAAQNSMRHAWLRLFSTFGPDDNEAWLIPTLISKMLRGERPQTTLGTQFWDWLYIDDVARGVLAAATSHSAQGVFNLGSGEAIQVRRAIEAIRDLAAPGMELVYGEIPFRPDQVMHMQANAERLKAATGWNPLVPFATGIAMTVAWYR
ncbi:MAG: NAD-dependent epimerase/dehydratase family protein, partial [Novosphingobium sp.]